MSIVLDKLFCNHVAIAMKSEAVGKLEAEIEHNEKWLKQHLNKRQTKLLLRIEDRKDLIKDLNSAESFAAGFKMGLKLGFEVNEK